MLVVLIGCHEQVLLDFHLANIAPKICLTANHCQNQKLLQCITNKPCVFLSGLLARQQCDSKWSNDCFVSHWRHLFFAGDIRRFIDTLSMLSQATLSELIGKLSISIFRFKKSRLKETSVRTGGTPGVRFPPKDMGLGVLFVRVGRLQTIFLVSSRGGNAPN